MHSSRREDSPRRMQTTTLKAPTSEFRPQQVPPKAGRTPSVRCTHLTPRVQKTKAERVTFKASLEFRPHSRFPPACSTEKEKVRGMDSISTSFHSSAGKMASQLTTPAPEPNNLRLIPRTHEVEGENQCL